MASNLVSGAKSLIQTTSSAVVGMGRSSPRAAAEFDPSAIPPESPLTGQKVSASKLDDPEGMSEDEQKRIMRMIEEDDSSDEEEEDSDEVEDSQGQVQTKDVKAAGSDNDSFCSDNDILNRELELDCGEPMSAENYLRYASDKYNAKLDILEIIDKNERSFKHVAEKMIQQSSQLEVHEKDAAAQP